MLKILHTDIHAGLSAPVKIMQITDVHLLEADQNDPPALYDTIRFRHDIFYEEGGHPEKSAVEYFEEALRYAEAHGDFPVLTGDIIDLNTSGSRAAFHRIIDGHDVMFTPGGHEFQKRFVRTMEEDYPYAETVRPFVESCFPQFDFSFDSRILHGLNIITIDNSLDYFSEASFTRLKAEADKGLPMLLFMHDPLDDPILTCSVPKHPKVRLTDNEYRISLAAIDFITSCPLILAAVAGHHHLNNEYLYRGRKIIVTQGAFAGYCREITVY